MDNQDNGAPARGPGIVTDVEQLGEDIAQGARGVVDRVFGGAAVDRVEKDVEELLTLEPATAAASAVNALKTLGAGHFHLSQLDVSSELADAKAKVEGAIVAIARYFGRI